MQYLFQPLGVYFEESKNVNNEYMHISLFPSQFSCMLTITAGRIYLYSIILLTLLDKTLKVVSLSNQAEPEFFTLFLCNRRNVSYLCHFFTNSISALSTS